MLTRPRQTFSDLLNWGAAVAPGVVVCKDGSMLAAWEIRDATRRASRRKKDTTIPTGCRRP